MDVSDFVDRIVTLDAASALAQLVTLGLALIISLPVAWDRERANRIAGLRTFPLVAVSSAAYVLIARETVSAESGAGHHYIIQGLMTGLGFLGAGAIIQSGDRVRGMATATALWSTAAIGAAVAYRRVEIAIVLALIVFASLRILQPIKDLAAAHRD